MTTFISLKPEDQDPAPFVPKSRTHLVKPAVASPVAPFASQIINQSKRTVIMNTNEITPFHSQAIQKQVAFWASKYVGMCATRIQRLCAGKFIHAPSVTAEEHFAEFGKYPDGSKEECRRELTDAAAYFNWAVAVAPFAMDNTKNIIISEIESWAGGGYTKKVREEQIEGWIAQGMTREQAINQAQKGAVRTRDYLAVKREKLGETMLTQVESVLARTEPKEPDTDTLRSIMQKGYENAYMFENQPEMLIIRGDFRDNLGEEPVIPQEDANQAAKAARIREALANRQEERAQQEVEQLRNFDPLAA